MSYSVTFPNSRTRGPGSSPMNFVRPCFQMLRFNQMKLNTEINLGYILKYYHSMVFCWKKMIYMNTCVCVSITLSGCVSSPYYHQGQCDVLERALTLKASGLQFESEQYRFTSLLLSRMFYLDNTFYVILNNLYKISDILIGQQQVSIKGSHSLTKGYPTQLSQHRQGGTTLMIPRES